MNTLTQHTIKGLFTGFLVSLLGLSGTALAQVSEVEPNDGPANAQLLTMTGDSLVVNGAMESNGVDIYAIYALADDNPSILVRSGNCGTGPDPTVHLFDENGNSLRMHLDLVFDAFTYGYDLCDAWIQPTSALPTDGLYYIIVTNAPNIMTSGFQTTSTSGGTGSYEMTVSGFSAGAGPVAETEPDPVPLPDPVIDELGPQKITMEVLHWRGRDGDVSKRWKKRMKRAKKRMVRRYGVYPIPVVMFGSDEFETKTIYTDTLRFGAEGNEDSLFRCSRRTFDVNRDGKEDMLCFFDAFKSGFEVGDVEGKLTGESEEGLFESAATLKVFKVSKGKGKKWKKRAKRHERWKQRRNQSRWHRHHD